MIVNTNHNKHKKVKNKRPWNWKRRTSYVLL